MALIICSECGKEFSNKANACPNCGCPIEQMRVTNDGETSLDAIWSTVPEKCERNEVVKYRTTQKVGPVKVDEANRVFQINGTIPNNGKKSGIIGKSFKGLMAVSTMGMSVVAEKAIGAGANKVGTSQWYDFTDLISYELIEDDSVVTTGGVGQALVGGALFGGAGAIAGGITGKRVQKKRVESLYIKATLNNFKCPCILIPLITKPTKTNSKEYKVAFEEAHRILSVLDAITHNK